MIKRLITKKINSITTAALLIALSSLVSRFLGIFRDRILASEFGAGDMLDVYYASFRIPDFVFNLLVLGALSAGFIPVFSGLLKKPTERIKDVFRKKDHKEAWYLAANIFNILGLFLIIICGVGIIFAPLLMKLIAPGFDGAQLETTVKMTRIMFLSPMLLGVSSVLGGIMQSFKRFFVYSLSPIMYNLGIIMGALFLVPFMGIYGLAWGVVIGAFFHMVIQLPVAFGLGFRFKSIFDFKHKPTLKIGAMMIPRTMSLAISQINLVVITIIASILPAGSLTVFNLANNLQFFPISIFGISFAIAVFPTLSENADNAKKLVENFSGTFRKILFFVVPSTVLLILLRAQIIRVILGAGKFDWEDTILTIDTLGFFAISLFAQATIPLLVRVFYARKDSRTPFFIGLVSATANIFLSIYFSRKMGVAGLALAFSLANILNFILLWLTLRLQIGRMDEDRILVSAVKFSAAAIGCGIGTQVMKIVSVNWLHVDMTTFLGVLTQGAIAGLSGLLMYGLICWILKSEEFIHFWEMFKCRCLGMKKVETGDQGEARGI